MVNITKENIIIIGGGGHGRVLIDLINVSGLYKIVGIVDAQLVKGEKVSGYFILGNDAILPELYAQGIKNACIGLGWIKDNHSRVSLYNKVPQIGFAIPALIHPSAIVAQDITIAPGVQIMAGVIVQTGTQIKEDTIINTGARVDHDCVVGKHVHIAPGVTISGGCIIEDGAFIGVGATVIQGVRIGKDALIAAGAVVISDVPDGAFVKGIPAK